MAESAIEPLLADLRNVLEHVDPVPPAVLAAAKAAFAWRTIDAELAELVADSTAIESTLAGAGMRSAAAPRLLTFEAGELTIEVEVAETGATRRLVGQLVPVGRAAVTVRWAGGIVEAETDAIGRFVADGVPAGPASMSIRRTDSSEAVVTSWVVI